MPWPSNRRVLGTKVPRLDGPDKATGRAKYTYDINRPNMLHARIVRCPHAHARVRQIDTSAAERLPGYRAHHILAPPGTELFFAGAEVVAVAADTEEQAEDVKRAVRVEYEVLPHLVKEEDALRPDAPRTVGPQSNVRPGGEESSENFDAEAFRNIPPEQIHQGTYGASVVCHQCLEAHGLVAEWNADLTQLTVWCSTQFVPGTAAALATHFRIPASQVKCITHYMGGGFGSKFGPDIQGMAAAELARRTRRPVKLMLDRAEEVTTAGNRPSAYGTVRLAGDREGRLRAYEVDCYGTPGAGTGATVNFQGLPYVYTPPHYKRRHRVVRLNTGPARAMRAPGHPQSCLLTDQPLDDLAARLGLNPLEVRLRNLPPNDPEAVRTAPTSFAALRHTIYTQEIEIARRLSDWDRKWHPPGRGPARGPLKQGIGMALHTWGGAGRGNNDVTVTIHRDGSVLVQCATQDLGTGERTVLAIVVAEVLGLEPRQITVEIGDSSFGRATGSGGSTTTAGTAPAAFNAANQARQAFLAAIAPRLQVAADDLLLEAAQVRQRTSGRTWPWRQACALLGQNNVVGRGDWSPGLSNNGVGGVQVAEVLVDTETGVVRCTRIVAVQDCGLVVNKQGCESQVAGGVIMGLNYALFEERIVDRHTGRQVNPDMEFYKLAGIRDVPEILVHMLDMPERGVIGIGEPPTISTCAAIGNAIFNALGVRVPVAPYTPARVLAALAAARSGGNGS